MNTKKIISALTALPVLFSCTPPPIKPLESTCSTAIFEKADKTNKASVDAAADLTAFAKAPIKGNFKAEVSRIFNATFQKVPDKDSACAMLNQTYLCITDAERATQFLSFIKETKQCSK